MSERIYLDWNATTPLRPEARQAMAAAWDIAGNPSSVHTEGRQARRLIEDARALVASAVGGRAQDVVFTSGGTEANALALTPGDGEDGFVTPGDLGRLRLNADLVVLSACRTAGGVVVDGEGMQGLTAPLLEAGARSVVATSWRVGDTRIVPLVERFYAGLARGLPVVDALRAAKLEARRSGAPPAVWAAFTIVGDPFATVALRPFARPER